MGSLVGLLWKLYQGFCCVYGSCSTNTYVRTRNVTTMKLSRTHASCRYGPVLLPSGRSCSQELSRLAHCQPRLRFKLVRRRDSQAVTGRDDLPTELPSSSVV